MALKIRCVDENIFRDLEEELSVNIFIDYKKENIMNYAELCKEYLKGNQQLVARRLINGTKKDVLELAACFVTHPKIGVDELYKLGVLINTIEKIKKGSKENRECRGNQIWTDKGWVTNGY